MTLTGILLTFLFSYFVESIKVEKKIDTARTEIISRQHLQVRLQSIFMGLDRSQEGPPFYTKKFSGQETDSLVAFYDQGIDPDPEFSGTVLARLFLDEKNNLTLATWPPGKEQNPPWRTEVLLDNVSEYTFEFLAPKIPKESKEKTRPINDDVEWVFTWPKSRSGIPSMIRLSVWKDGAAQPLCFAFILPSPDPMVTYQQEGFKI